MGRPSKAVRELRAKYGLPEQAPEQAPEQPPPKVEISQDVEMLADFFEIAIPTIHEVKAALALATLRMTERDCAKAAELLSVTPETVRNWCNKYLGGLKNANI